MIFPPRTVQDAVSWLKEHMPPDTIDAIRGMRTREDTLEFHFGLTSWIRAEFGLWGKNDALNAACATDHADSTSNFIIRALWDDLQRTSTPEQLIAARAKRDLELDEREQRKQAQLAALATKERAITSNTCSACGKPRLSYRKSCKYCGITFV